MLVQEILIDTHHKRYILIDEKGIPVLPVVRYLKYLDITGKSRNTQKTYCYALKHYFTYLGEIKKDYLEITYEDLVKFVGWLRSPYQSALITPLKPHQI